MEEGINKKESKEIDDLTKNVDSFRKENFVFIKKNKTRSWKIIFAIAFVLGMAISFLLMVIIRAQN
jgi:hypothetical protein